MAAIGSAQTIGGTRHVSPDPKALLARATPFRSGDALAGLAAETAAGPAVVMALAPGLTPEMVAAISIIMRVSDLMQVAAKCRAVTRFRNAIGLLGTLSIRLQPSHPTDDPRSVAAGVLDGLRLGAGEAAIGVNPATDNVEAVMALLRMLDTVRERFAIPTQTSVLSHVTTTMLALERGTLGDNVMYAETGQGSAPSAEAHHGVDQQTIEGRAYAVAREFSPLLVNSGLGFIGPEDLFDGKQNLRAWLEDHFCGRLLGLAMGVDVCYTNHAEADQDDMRAPLACRAVAGVTYGMGVPGADDVMIAYQSISFHDALTARAARQARGAGIRGLARPHRHRPGRQTHPGAAVAGTHGSGMTTPTLWHDLRRSTDAPVGLGRAGTEQPTAAPLDFQEAHARARDAVWSALDMPALEAAIACPTHGCAARRRIAGPACCGPISGGGSRRPCCSGSCPPCRCRPVRS